MISRFPKIQYEELSSPQKEKFNFQKVSAVPADYGFATIPLTDDWNGADFLALHRAGETLKVQLKSRITVSKRYVGKEIWVAAPHDGGWFIYPHDETMAVIHAVSPFIGSQSWQVDGTYTWPSPSRALLEVLEPHFIQGNASAG